MFAGPINFSVKKLRQFLRSGGNSRATFSSPAPAPARLASEAEGRWRVILTLKYNVMVGLEARSVPLVLWTFGEVPRNLATFR